MTACWQTPWSRDPHESPRQPVRPDFRQQWSPSKPKAINMYKKNYVSLTLAKHSIKNIYIISTIPSYIIFGHIYAGNPLIEQPLF